MELLINTTDHIPAKLVVRDVVPIDFPAQLGLDILDKYILYANTFANELVLTIATNAKAQNADRL